MRPTASVGAFTAFLVIAAGVSVGWVVGQWATKRMGLR